MSTIKSRYIWILIALVMLFATSAQGQSMPGSNIVSRTYLSSDSTRMLVQRVYDNGLGDIVQEIQSYPGSTLPSIVIRHEYDEYRRQTKSWLPVISYGSGFVNSNTIAYQAGLQYSDAAPFSRTVYDEFLPSHPSAQYKAGAQWHGHWFFTIASVSLFNKTLILTIFIKTILT